MALRFRRSFKLAPGLRMNLSGSGASFSAGPRGASMTFGKRGTFANTGIPGTGLYARQRVGTPSAPRRDPNRPQKIAIDATIAVEEDGTVTFKDAHGNPLPPEWVARAKRQIGDKIRKQIEDACATINGRAEALAAIHVQTPAPDARIRYEPQSFDEPPPRRPYEARHGFLGWLFKSRRERIDAENAARRAQYESAIAKWQTQKSAFEEAERKRRELLEERVFSDVDAMEEILQSALQAIAWPRETAVSAEVDEGGRLVLLDVDLPEIEDMPKTTASVPTRGYKLTVKEMPAAKIQNLYMDHVYGIGFRIIGEVFAVLPRAEEVVLSAFSQRSDKATGEIRDDYLYSVRVRREQWIKITFDNLGALHPAVALGRFELRCDVVRGGFLAIEPLSSGIAATT